MFVTDIGQKRIIKDHTHFKGDIADDEPYQCLRYLPGQCRIKHGGRTYREHGCEKQQPFAIPPSVGDGTQHRRQEGDHDSRKIYRARPEYGSFDFIRCNFPGKIGRVNKCYNERGKSRIGEIVEAPGKNLQPVRLIGQADISSLPENAKKNLLLKTEKVYRVLLENNPLKLILNVLNDLINYSFECIKHAFALDGGSFK